MSKHILIVSQYFYPENFRINDIAKEWVKRGNKVTVITGIPNYPEGRFYKGYGLFKSKNEIYEGITIKRINIFPRGKNNVSLIINYFSFVISGFFWKSFTSLKPDLVFIFEVSPMTQALPAVWFAKKRRIPCYIYVQDLWPENLEIIGGIRNRKVIKLINRMVDYIYKNCKKIFVTSQSFRKYIISHNVQSDKVIFWPQFAEEFYKPIQNNDLNNQEVFKVMFTGNIGKAQGLSILPELARKLIESGYENKIKFILVGDGRDKDYLIRLIKKQFLSHMFEFVSKQPSQTIPLLLSSADVAFISFTNNKLFRMTIPAKLQSYMACGKPIFAIAEGETKRIVNDANCGLCSNPGDLASAYKNLLEFYKMKKSKLTEMSSNALNYSKTNFNKTNLIDKMEQYLQ